MNWKRFFHLGVVYYMLDHQERQEEEQLLTGLEKIAMDTYFDAVEVAAISDQGLRRKVGQLVHGTGLRLVYAAQPLMIKEQLNLASPDRKDRLKALNRVKQAVEEAYELGAERMVIMDGFRSYPGQTREQEALAYLLETISEICFFVECQGDLRLSLETFDRSVDKYCLLGPTKLAADLIKQLATEHCCLELTLDTAHAVLLEEQWEQALLDGQGFVRHLHLGNCVLGTDHPLSGDSHPPLGFPRGEVGVPELAALFLKLMLHGLIRPGNINPFLISFEVNGDIHGPKLTLAHCKRMLDRAWNLSFLGG